MKPKVSVILTSYNHGKYLREAIESTLNQTFSDFELLIWDDVSTDDSMEIIQSYDDPRIRVFQNDERRRHECSLNRAIFEEAKADFIAIHHSDDIWMPTKLEKQIQFIEENPQYGAVFTKVIPINENGEFYHEMEEKLDSIFGQPNRNRFEWLNYFFFFNNAVAHPSALIRKKCFDECGLYNSTYTQISDYDMWIRIALRYEIHIIQEPLIKYRIRDNEANLSAPRQDTKRRHWLECYKMLKHYLQIVSENDFYRVFPEAVAFRSHLGFDHRYMFARVCLLEKAPKYVKLLGLDILFEILWDQEAAKKVKEIYGFDYMAFVDLKAKYDVFSLGEVEEYVNQINQLKEELR